MVGPCVTRLLSRTLNKAWPWLQQRKFSNGRSNDFARRYEALIRDEVIREDERQRNLLRTLSLIFSRIRKEAAVSDGPKSNRVAKARKGCYIHGPVGAGKTMLMHMFYESVQSLLPTRRVHFHEFMLSIHSRIHTCKPRPGVSAIQEVAQEIASESQVLCLDEVQLVDIADVAILSQILPVLWKQGVCMIATSNVPPSRLFEGGLNRHVYMPKLERLLADHCFIFDMSCSGVEDRDHRQDTRPAPGLYRLSNARESFDSLSVMWTFLSALDCQRNIIQQHHSESGRISLPYGRSLLAKKLGRRIIWLEFASLFDSATGATDFLTIANK